MNLKNQLIKEIAEIIDNFAGDNDETLEDKAYRKLIKETSQEIADLFDSYSTKLIEEVRTQVIGEDEKVPHRSDGVVQCTCHRGMYPKYRAQIKNELRASQRAKLSLLERLK